MEKILYSDFQRIFIKNIHFHNHGYTFVATIFSFSVLVEQDKAVVDFMGYCHLIKTIVKNFKSHLKKNLA